jgi:hypothetical protein
MTKHILVIVLFITSHTYSQTTNKEFEGTITYKTTIVPKVKDLDSNIVRHMYKVCGRESVYYFKAGNFKWVPKNSDLEYEIFNYSKGSVLVEKVRGNDTPRIRDIGKADSIVSVKKIKQKTILNILCNAAQFTVTDAAKPGAQLIRTMYYPVNGLKYQTDYYSKYKVTGNSYIAAWCKAIPLRLEVNSNAMPVIIVYEAVKIQRKPVADAEFQFDEKLAVKK